MDITGNKEIRELRFDRVHMRHLDQMKFKHRTWKSNGTDNILERLSTDQFVDRNRYLKTTCQSYLWPSMSYAFLPHGIQIPMMKLPGTALQVFYSRIKALVEGNFVSNLHRRMNDINDRICSNIERTSKRWYCLEEEILRSVGLATPAAESSTGVFFDLHSSECFSSKPSYQVITLEKLRMQLITKKLRKLAMPRMMEVIFQGPKMEVWVGQILSTTWPAT